ncbi:MAG: hypothetical protein QGF09_14835 [Rhodospirillales bacterium]|jgi:hypothetical protein|nr:hypothetical protein [Rhodospirillales bacterium]
MNKKSPEKDLRETAKPADERVFVGGGDAHAAFQTQVQTLLANANITEDERQQILTSMSCPCCGGGGASISIKLDR